ncbi:forespore capture DNA-binding protein RefZ [Ectobacillus panaciterrae]|uniref:forespore capture DNA-binding protein RefZ n=1 Tax=Ectobacillus panaciterrae TaxID=363872 RepID=UPI000414EF2C|nr:forespore capture DNA-binding protein RefZ [Ectobacillus panaciterrae]
MTCTKQKIIDAAVFLFNTQGYNGTSVRDIAKKANVNAANISYYFSGKQGLLEHLVTDFLEGYIGILERAFEMQAILSPKEMLLMVVRDILRYQSENRHLTRFFYREISLDSMLIREIMTTYFMREKYYFQTIIQNGIEQGEFRKVLFSVFMSQLKGMLSVPYLYPQYISEVLHVFPSEEYFTRSYAKELECWLEQALEPKKQDRYPTLLHL